MARMKGSRPISARNSIPYETALSKEEDRRLYAKVTQEKRISFLN